MDDPIKWAKKLLSGGDRKNNTGSGYSLTDVGNTHSAYLTPYVSVNEKGRFFNVPPASHVGQLYMSKHNDKNVLPWSVIAGIQFSRLTTIAGVEEKFNNDSLTDLHDFGITTIHNYENTIFY